MISKESGKALKELASTIRKMTKGNPVPDLHVANSKVAAEDLKSALKSGLSNYEVDDLLEIIPTAAVASILVEIVTCTGQIAEAVHELESLANFKRAKPRVTPEDHLQPQVLVLQPHSDGDHHVVTINDESSPSSARNENTSTSTTTAQ